MVALNFADDREASSFHDVVYATITSRTRKERRNNTSSYYSEENDYFYGETQVLTNNQHSSGNYCNINDRLKKDSFGLTNLNNCE